MRLRPCERGRAIEQAKRKAQRYQPVTDVHVSSSSGSFILLRLSLPNQQQLYSQERDISLPSAKPVLRTEPRLAVRSATLCSHTFSRADRGARSPRCREYLPPY